MYRVQLRSKNPSANELRGLLKTVRTSKPFVVRLGSRTPTEEIFPRSYSRTIELNSIESIENSRNKLMMKNRFAAAGANTAVRQSKWFEFIQQGDILLANKIDSTESPIRLSELPYPIVVKQICGFKGHGMVKCENLEELNNWLSNHTISGYYIEEFKNFAKEYRLHCTQNEMFLAWRKLRREDAEQRWFFNSTNCNWVGEEHELFDKPEAWDLICEHAIRAIKATGLTIGAVDVRCKSNTSNENDFIVLEVNSAPELGSVGTEKYFEVLTKIIKDNESL